MSQTRNQRIPVPFLWTSTDPIFLEGNTFQGGQNLENMENLEKSGNLKNCQNVGENSDNFFISVDKPGKLGENVRCVT